MTTPTDRIRSLLQAKSVLAGLPEAELDALARRAPVATFAKGTTLYQRGDAADHMMVILSGRVKISNITDEAREVILNFLGAGDLNGELAALDGNSRSADSIALERTEVAILYRRDFIPALERHPQAMLDIIALLTEKLRMTSALVEHSQLQMASRAANGLLRLAASHGRTTAGSVLVDLKLSQRDLGAYFGLSRENTSRELGRLKEQGLIKVDDGEIVIADLDALRAWAEQNA